MKGRGSPAGGGLAWVAGRVRGADAARVPVAERAFRYGDGVFATVRCQRGCLLDAAAQLDRLAGACRTLGLERPAELADVGALLGVLRRLGVDARRTFVVRAQASAGVSGRGYARPPEARSWALVEVFAPPKARRLTAAVAPAGLLLPPPAVPGVKSCSALPAVLAARAAAALGTHEVLRVDGGRLTEASAANLFWLRDRVLHTPAVSLPIYPGVTRAVVLEAAEGLGVRVEEGSFPPAALAGADAAFLTNAVRGVEPIRRLDGRSLPWPEEARSLARAVSRRRRARGVPLAGGA